jgi:hypothetical protein
MTAEDRLYRAFARVTILKMIGMHELLPRFARDLDPSDFDVIIKTIALVEGIDEATVIERSTIVNRCSLPPEPPIVGPDDDAIVGPDDALATAALDARERAMRTAARRARQARRGAA